LVVKLAQGHEISFETRLHSPAGTDDRSSGSIETGVRVQATADVRKPHDRLPEQIQAGGDLDKRQNIEKIFHASRE
jgi:hypothetical protein